MSLKVIRRMGEPINFLVKRMKRLMERSGKSKEIQSRKCYIKPSELRRRKAKSKKYQSQKPKREAVVAEWTTYER